MRGELDLECKCKIVESREVLDMETHGSGRLYSTGYMQRRLQDRDKGNYLLLNYMGTVTTIEAR